MAVAIDHRHTAEDRHLAILVANGRTSAQIAEHLGIKHGAARYRLRKAMERAGADTAPEFAALVLPERRVAGFQPPAWAARWSPSTAAGASR